MSNYKDRSDYFKMIAGKNILIANDRNYIVDENGNIVYTEDGHVVGTDGMRTRRSFFRINNEEELNAASVNWMHFPCVVHVGHDLRFRQNGTGIPRRIMSNNLLFLAKPEMGANNFLADAIEAAYDITGDAMAQFISYMVEDLAENGACGNLFLFSLDRAHAEQIGPVNSNLYGWQLTFEDEAKAQDLVYDSDKWFEGPNE